jgi:predicted metal-binding protein
VQLEKLLKKKGFNKAFALSAQPCELCDPCTIATSCQFPEKARPTLQACGIDVNETINNNGWDDLGQQTPCTPNHSIGMVLMD